MTAPVLSQLLDQLTGGPALQQIGRQLGVDDATARSAVESALPVLLGGLSRNVQAGGGDALLAALDRDHDGSILDDLAGFLGNAQGGPGAGILKHVLGAQQQQVSAGLGQATGLGPQGASSLLALLAPLVLGALGKARRGGAVEPGSLGGLLGMATQQLGARVPGGGASGLLGLLDADKDGSVVDDVLGMAAKFLKR